MGRRVGNSIPQASCQHPDWSAVHGPQIETAEKNYAHEIILCPAPNNNCFASKGKCGLVAPYSMVGLGCC